MMTKLKSWAKGMLAAVLVAAAAGGAWAADPDTDSLTITITPVVDLGVDVDTASSKMAGSADLTLSNVALGSTVYIDNSGPALVTIKGSYNKQEMRVSAAGLDTWQVDEDETIEADKVQVYALFAVAKASSPLEAEFGSDGGNHLVHAMGTSLVAGESAAEDGSRGDNSYEIPGADMTAGANMDDLMVNTQRKLWLRLDTPADSSVDETQAQRIQVTVTAVNGRTL